MTELLTILIVRCMISYKIESLQRGYKNQNRKKTQGIKNKKRS